MISLYNLSYDGFRNILRTDYLYLSLENQFLLATNQERVRRKCTIFTFAKTCIKNVQTNLNDFFCSTYLGIQFPKKRFYRCSITNIMWIIKKKIEARTTEQILRSRTVRYFMKSYLFSFKIRICNFNTKIVHVTSATLVNAVTTSHSESTIPPL